MLAAALLAVLVVARTEATPTITAQAREAHHLLAKAFDSFLDGQQRWAYTETYMNFAPDGRSLPLSAVCVDPSLPYEQQFVPLQLVGRPPTKKETKEWVERGEQLAKRHHAAEERQAALPQDTDFRIRLFSQEVTPDIDRATIAAEDETSVTFAIPLRRAGGPDRAEFTAFALTARVGKLTSQFENATFTQRSTIRVAAGKNSNGLLEVEFGIPDARFPSVPVKLSWRSTNKAFFGQVSVSRSETVRTDLRRVAPYDERFRVKLAPLRLIEL